MPIDPMDRDSGNPGRPDDSGAGSLAVSHAFSSVWTKITPITREANARRGGRVSGSVICPPDKSLTHRAVMFASLARGESRILDPLLGADCRSTMSVFRKLGVEIAVAADGVTVRSPGWKSLRSPAVHLDCGNSGTTARLLLGILAATPGINCHLTGDPSLSRRPMGRVSRPLRNVGATIVATVPFGGGETLPLEVNGAVLRGGTHVVDKASAQVKSALLLAGMNVDGETTIELPSGSRDHTERMLLKLGAKLRVEQVGGVERISLRGPVTPQPINCRIPGDPSSAAFMAVAAALAGGGRLRIVRVMANPTRAGFIAVLRRMGVSITTTAHEDPLLCEDAVDLDVVAGAELRGTDMLADEIPALVDEVPVLALAAAFANSPSVFHGLAELRVKESDRLQLTADLVNAIGGRAEVVGDSLRVAGGLVRPKGFRFDPEGDHRLAMCAALAARHADGEAEVCGMDCVVVSFPNFLEVLASAVR